jgi:hypothetical protein
MKAYVVIGEAQTRKSTLVRCLTGCASRGVRQILTRDGDELVLYARVLALQESGTSAQDFIAEARASGCKQTLFCLWPGQKQSRGKSYPSADTHIREFRQAGWQIHRIAVLGEPAISLPWRQMAQFADVNAVPINLTAARVRDYFGWV